jgi:hypothetical protein
MKNLIALCLLSASCVAVAEDKNAYNPNSYGSTPLYYSPEGERQRQEAKELELLKERNVIEKERLEVERQRLDEERKYERKVYDNE